MLTLELWLDAPTAARPECAVANAAVVNTGSAPRDIDLIQLSSPSLALEITDASGKRVPLPPPPTPVASRSTTIALRPGERKVVTLRAFLPLGTPRGRYNVRLRYGEAASNPVVVEVTG